MDRSFCRSELARHHSHSPCEQYPVASGSGRTASQAILCGDHTHTHGPIQRPGNFSRPILRQQQRNTATHIAATRQERRKEYVEVDDSSDGEDGDKDKGFFASGAALVNTLLFGAASRIERGTSVCVSCRGTGTMICKECDATGVVKSKKSKNPSSRDSGNRMKNFVGTKSKEKQFIVSNRCRNCRGHGRLECPHCEGIGKRNVGQRDMWT